MSKERYDLSRRKVLAGMGSIGVAAAGAGLGTSAFFSDQETFTNNQLVAGSLDLQATASHHYVDWLGDEADDGSMADTDDEADLVLEAGQNQAGARDIRLEIGDAVGLATGSLENEVNGGVPLGSEIQSLCGGGNDVDGPVLIDLDDVKPGDFGIARFAFESCTNPAFLWLTGDLVSASENGTNEPEESDPDEQDGVVELLDAIRVAKVPVDAADLLVDNADDDDGDPTLSISGDMSLRDLLEGNLPMDLPGDIPANQGGGASEARNCFSGNEVHRCSLIWWLPIDHGNEVQTDSAVFNLGLYAEQCRHNDGSGMANRPDP